MILSLLLPHVGPHSQALIVFYLDESQSFLTRLAVTGLPVSSPDPPWPSPAQVSAVAPHRFQDQTLKPLKSPTSETSPSPLLPHASALHTWELPNWS